MIAAASKSLISSRLISHLISPKKDKAYGVAVTVLNNQSIDSSRNSNLFWLFQIIVACSVNAQSVGAIYYRIQATTRRGTSEEEREAAVDTTTTTITTTEYSIIQSSWGMPSVHCYSNHHRPRS